jgi:hypothetical protein
MIRDQRSAGEDVLVSVRHPDHYAAIRRTAGDEVAVALPQRACAITQGDRAVPWVSNEDVRTHARKEPTFAAGNYKQIGTECRRKDSVRVAG